jgi:hypothetical protein
MDFIVDGNAYLNIAISVTRSMAYKDKSIGSKYYVNDIFNEGEFILKDQVRIHFRNFCLNYFNSLVAPIGKKLDRVHLVFDSKSWRREYIRKFFNSDSFSTDVAPTEFTYKGNRKKDDTIHLFFDYFQKEIVPILVEMAGINYYRIYDTEGDDIIAYLCETLDTDILIYTVDGDMKQLTYSSDKNIIVIYPKQMSKHKKICVPREFRPDLAQDEVDNFFSLNESHVTTSTISKTINTLKNRDYVEYVIDPVLEIFTKIFRGDKKDNIPRIDKMTPTKTTKLIELIKNEYGDKSIGLLDDLDETFINFIVKNISILNKINDISQLKDTRNHLLFNARIIRLSSKLFPERVRTSLDEHIKNNITTKFDLNSFTKLKNNPSLI